MRRSDISIRPAIISDVKGIARVHVDTWRSTYAGIVPDDYLAQLKYEKREAMWTSVIARPDPRSHLLVAECSGEVVGFSSGGPDRSEQDAAEIFAIYLLTEYQGCGIGCAMFRDSFRLLQRDGFRSIVLWALAENPTCRFYRSTGGVDFGEKQEEIGGKKLREIAFKWTEADMNRFIGEAKA